MIIAKTREGEAAPTRPRFRHPRASASGRCIAAHRRSANSTPSRNISSARPAEAWLGPALAPSRAGDRRERGGEAAMCDLVARTGRHLQRYEGGRRLVAGCIPFRMCDDEQKKLVEVLMINSQSGPGLLFPKGGWENDETVEEAAAREAIEEAGVRGDLVQLLGFYDFKSKKLQDEFSPEGMCRAAVFALHVKEELVSWPEQSTRQRRWLTVPEAAEQSRHPWVQEALVTGFSVWLENWCNGGVCPDQSKR